MAGTDAFVMAFFRSAIPVAFLLLLSRFSPRGIGLNIKGNRSLYTASTLNALRSLLFFQALILTDISKAVIMLYTWPVFAFLINTLLGREKATLTKVLLLCTTFSGIVLIYWQGFVNASLERRDYWGMSVMIVSAFFYSLTFVIFKEQGRDRNHYELTFFQNVVAVPVFFLFVLFRVLLAPGGQETGFTATGIGFASLNGLVIGIFGFLLYYKGMRQLAPSIASQLAYLEVVFASLWGIFLYHDQVSPGSLFGSILILGGALGQSLVPRSGKAVNRPMRKG